MTFTALREKVTIRRGGWISLRSRALKAGATAEVIVLVDAADARESEPVSDTLTAADLLNSGLVGIWAKKDVGDSLEFARGLRAVAGNEPL